MARPHAGGNGVGADRGRRAGEGRVAGYSMPTSSISNVSAIPASGWFRSRCSSRLRDPDDGDHDPVVELQAIAHRETLGRSLSPDRDDGGGVALAVGPLRLQPHPDRLADRETPHGVVESLDDLAAPDGERERRALERGVEDLAGVERAVVVDLHRVARAGHARRGRRRRLAPPVDRPGGRLRRGRRLRRSRGGRLRRSGPGRRVRSAARRGEEGDRAARRGAPGGESRPARPARGRGAGIRHSPASRSRCSAPSG